MKRVFVAGAGAMGGGIAQVCAQAGYEVDLTDQDPVAVERTMERMNWSLGKLHDKGRIQEKPSAVLARVHPCDGVEEARRADLAIEAVFEDLQVKRDILKRIEAVCSGEALLATNTSSLSVTEIGSVLDAPERLVGIHFFNPVQRMALVEVVRGLSTTDEALETAQSFVLSLGKDPVLVQRDTAGFIVNRINGMTFLEALRLFEKGVATPEDIDKAMRLGLGHPMGPFELMDMVGLDVVLRARMGIYDETRDPNHAPPAVLRRMVSAGRLGRKSGRGFYDYET